MIDIGKDNRDYKLDIEWINDIGRLGKKLKENYLKKQIIFNES